MREDVAEVGNKNIQGIVSISSRVSVVKPIKSIEGELQLLEYIQVRNKSGEVLLYSDMVMELTQS